MHFSTVFGLAAAFLSLASAGCTPGSVQIGSRQCKVQCGIDRPGGDYGNQYTGTFDKCMSACATDAKCSTAQFHISNGYCYFKDSRNAAVTNSNDNTIDCEPAVATCQSGPVTLNGRSCNVQCGIDRPGGDYGAKFTGSFDGCMAACAADTRCLTAQYHISNGYCYLKNTRNKAVADANDDTIDCEQPVTT